MTGWRGRESDPGLVGGGGGSSGESRGSRFGAL